MKAAVLVVAWSLFCAIDGAKILTVVPTPTKSHHNLVSRLAEELVKNGHQVTLITAFPRKEPLKNLEEIIFPNYYEQMIATFKGKNDGSITLADVDRSFFMSFAVQEMGMAMTSLFLSSQTVKEFIISDRKYDLIIGELFFVEAVLAGLSHKFQAPLIGVSTSTPGFWVNHLVGNPAPSSYIPSPMLGYSTEMNFLERLKNFLMETISTMYFSLWYLPRQDQLLKKHFGSNLPYVEDLMANMSLILVNHHHSLSHPRPYLPNMIEVGGFHVKPPEPLPKDLKLILDNAKHGAILFSMGSHFKSAQLPREKLNEFLKAFARLKQTVLWKFEDKSLTGVPKNVKIFKWLPQSDLLAHPNLKLFITHGGFLSITESAVRGVPLLGLPVFGDQPANMMSSERLGYGKSLDLFNINEDVFYNGIVEVWNNPRYSQKAKEVSVLLQDTPKTAVETALYWTEYIIRHKGAPHMRSAVLNLKWYQVYLLDVAFTIIAIGFALTWIAHQTTKWIFRIITSRSFTRTPSGKKNN